MEKQGLRPMIRLKKNKIPLSSSLFKLNFIESNKNSVFNKSGIMKRMLQRIRKMITGRTYL